MSNTFHYCVNTSVVNKSDDFLSLTTEFVDKEGTIHDVADHVKRGHSLCASLFNGASRSKANVFGSQWLMLDVDNSEVATDESGNPIDEKGKPITIDGYPVNEKGDRIDKRDSRQALKVYKKELTIEEALEHPFIKNHCSMIYTTASHSNHWHRLRLIFVLDKFYQDRDLIESMIDLLMEQLPHDPSCKDASRIFYGNTEAQFPLINPKASLPTGWDVLAASKANMVKERRAELEEKAKQRRKEFQELSNAEGWNVDQLINDALFSIPPRSPGSQNYQECLTVLMALHSHYGDECEALAELWSPSIPGNTWNISRKIRSFRRDGTTIGSLFAIAKRYGFKFPEVKNPENKKLVRAAQSPVMDKYEEAQYNRKKDGYDDLIQEISEAKTTIADLARRSFTFERIIKKFSISKRTFDQALARVDALADPSQKTTYKFSDFVRMHEQSKSWVLPGILQRGELAIFAGPPKSGKSLHSYEAAYQVLTGGMFCGGYVPKGKVLFIQSDEGASSTIERIYDRQIYEHEENFLIMPKFSFARMETLEQVLIDFRPDLVIVDTLRQALRATGIDENTAEAGNPLSDFKEMLQKYHASAILIHYTKKGDATGQARIQGSNAIVANVFSAFEFSTPDKNKPSEFKMECLAMRQEGMSNYYHEFIQNGQGWYLSYTGDEGSADGEAGYSDRILELLKINHQKAGKTEFYASEVADLLGVTPDRSKGVFMALKRLAAKQRLIRSKQTMSGGRPQYFYRLSEAEIPRGGGSSYLPPRGYSGQRFQDSNTDSKHTQNTLDREGVTCQNLNQYEDPIGSKLDQQTQASISGNERDISKHKQGDTNSSYSIEPIHNNTSSDLVTLSPPPSILPLEPKKDAHPKGKTGVIDRTQKTIEYDHKGTPYFVGSEINWVDVLPQYSKMKSFVVERLFEDGVKLSMVREVIPHSQVEALSDECLGIRVGDRCTVDYKALDCDGFPVNEMIGAAYPELPPKGTTCQITAISKGKYINIKFTDGQNDYCQFPEYLIKV